LDTIVTTNRLILFPPSTSYLIDISIQQVIISSNLKHDLLRLAPNGNVEKSNKPCYGKHL